MHIGESMGLVKLAFTQSQSFDHTPVVVINNQQPSSSSSKTFNKQNITAALTGGTTGFLAQEGIERIPGFNKTNFAHKYGRRLGTVAGGFLGAAGVYHLMSKNNKQNKQNKIFIM